MSEFKQISISDLMTVIKKNTVHSRCIDVFEALLNEIKDKDAVKVFVSDMNKFIEEFMTIVGEIDKMDNVRIKSKILTYEFINPKRFFTKSCSIASKALTFNEGLREASPELINSQPYPNFVIGKTNKLGEPRIDYLVAQSELFKAYTKVEILEYHEDCRRVVLLWNYLPAIVKAFIQTKRRSLGLDNNSTKFN